MATAAAVEDARRRMGMPPDQVVMRLHTRTPFLSGTNSGTLPPRPPAAMWSAHSSTDPSKFTNELVGEVKSDLIETVFGTASSTFKKQQKKRKNERAGMNVLTRATMDYDAVLPQTAKNTGRWEPLYRLAKLDPSQSR